MIRGFCFIRSILGVTSFIILFPLLNERPQALNQHSFFNHLLSIINNLSHHITCRSKCTCTKQFGTHTILNRPHSWANLLQGFVCQVHLSLHACERKPLRSEFTIPVFKCTAWFPTLGLSAYNSGKSTREHNIEDTASEKHYLVPLKRLQKLSNAAKLPSRFWRAIRLWAKTKG